MFKLSVSITSEAVQNLKNVVSLASSSPLINLFKCDNVSPSAGVTVFACRIEIASAYIRKIFL